MGRPVQIPDWLHEAIAQMVRTGCSLKQATIELELDIPNVDIVYQSHRAIFLSLLWEARHRYFAQLARSPEFQKDSVVGKLLVLAQKLEEEGAHEKSADVLFKLAKVQGYVGPESTVSVFGSLSQQDLSSIREKLSKGDIPLEKAN